MSVKPPVQRKGGSTKRPKGPRVVAAAKKKGAFTPGVILTLVVLGLIGGASILTGLGVFSSAPTAPGAAPTNAASPASSSPSPVLSATTAPASAQPTTSPSATAVTSETPVTGVDCTYTRSPAGGNGKFAGLPPAKAIGGLARATVTTNKGKILIELSSAAPCTVNSFTFLAKKGYFDGSKCHRLLNAPGFTALQCGDPSATGSGGPGYSFADENLAGATYPRGTIAMANSGPGTNGSQFFFVFQDSKFGPNYTPFGRILSGLELVDAIAAVGTDTGAQDGAPKSTITLASVKMD